MGDLATAVIVGRLTRDAELKYTNSGMAICHFSVATSSRVKKADQWVDEPSFWDVDLWGKLGETISQYLTKGKLVAVQGEMRQDRWEKDGQTRTKVVIKANDVQLLGSNQGTAGGGSSYSGSEQRPGGGIEGKNSFASRDSENRSGGYSPREGRSEDRSGASGARDSSRAPDRGSGPSTDDFTDDIPF